MSPTYHRGSCENPGCLVLTFVSGDQQTFVCPGCGHEGDSVNVREELLSDSEGGILKKNTDSGASPPCSQG